MKFQDPVTLGVLSPLSLREPKSMISVIEDHLCVFPKLTPEFWGQTEPTQKFDINQIGRLANSPGEIMGGAEMGGTAKVVERKCAPIYWIRRKGPKFWGSLNPGSGADDRATHSKVTLISQMNEISQELLIDYLKHFSKSMNADLGYIEARTPDYKSTGIANGAAQFGDDFFFTTHILRHWLPDIFWGTILGKTYIDLLEREKILSAPAAIVEEISDNLIYVQLTESFHDLRNKPRLVALARNQFKSHFSDDIFYNTESGEFSSDILMQGYSMIAYRTPNFQLT